MGSLTWNGGSGDWSVDSNWTVVSGSDVVPGAGDDVTIDAPGTYTITATGAQAVNNLTLNDIGATLAVVGSFGTLGLDGTLAVGGALTGEAGTLDLTHGGLTFAQSSTLDNLTVNYFGSLSPIDMPFTVPTGTTLTLGPKLLMDGVGTGFAVIAGAGTVVNEGTITAPGFPASLVINTAFDNQGSINAGYFIDATNSFSNNGTISFTLTSTPAKMLVAQDLSGSGTIIFPAFAGVAGAPLSVGGTIEALQHLVGPNHGVFSITAQAIDPAAIIYNFFAGSTIDLTGLPFSSSLQPDYSGTPFDGRLNITNGSTVEATIQFVGIPAGNTFDLSSDGGSPAGTDITTSAGPLPCFVTGTRIRTERGEVAVEELRVGDRVPVVRAGGSLPIVWIGHRRVRIDRHPRPWDVYPVRVAAGAFADFVPLRDLWLSPEHCVFLHGVLVPVRHLLNGSTIVQVPCPEVTYWHVELPSHDLLLCEGAWTESYLDMGNRAAFVDGNAERTDGGVLTLHPDFSRVSWEARACQQQERGGPVVAAIRSAIDARAAARSKAA